MSQRLWIPGVMPNLNDILEIRGAGKGRHNPWVAQKKKWASTVGLLAGHQQLKAIPPCCWTYLFVENDKRRDKRNVSGGAAKILEDALQDIKLIPNDGWSEILDYRDYFTVRPGATGVLLAFAPSLLSFEEMMGMLR